VLSEPMYATIVLIAVLTTVMAAPMLQFCVRRAGVEAETPVPAGLEAVQAPESGTMITS